MLLIPKKFSNDIRSITNLDEKSNKEIVVMLYTLNLEKHIPNAESKKKSKQVDLIRTFVNTNITNIQDVSFSVYYKNSLEGEIDSPEFVLVIQEALKQHLKRYEVRSKIIEGNEPKSKHRSFTASRNRKAKKIFSMLEGTNSEKYIQLYKLTGLIGLHENIPNPSYGIAYDKCREYIHPDRKNKG